MAWEAKGNDISMAEGDFGISIPFNVAQFPIEADDVLRFTVCDKMNGTILVVKEYTGAELVDGVVNLSLTESDSASLTVGNYVYGLDWYQNGAFMCNIIKRAGFRVVDKV